MIMHLSSIGQEQLLIPLDEITAGWSLKFENPKGSIKVTGYPGQTILVEAIPRYPDNDISTPAELTLGHEVLGKEVVIHASQGIKTVDYQIKVPREMALQLRSKDNGVVEVINIRGKIEVDNTNGHIILDNIRGSAVLNSVYGNISARFKTVLENAPMMMSTLEGDVILALPGDVKARLKMKSVHGSITTDLPYEMETKENTLDWDVAQLNGGGPEYILRSYNGHIHIEKYE